MIQKSRKRRPRRALVIKRVGKQREKRKEEEGDKRERDRERSGQS